MDPEHDNQSLLPEEGGADKALTSIHRRIHWPATPDTTESENELDQITIDHFLETLAEIAIAIARRREALDS